MSFCGLQPFQSIKQLESDFPEHLPFEIFTFGLLDCEPNSVYGDPRRYANSNPSALSVTLRGHGSTFCIPVHTMPP
jgi:hypothetical protein